jgi:iron complex transport system substrate-binding protein
MYRILIVLIVVSGFFSCKRAPDKARATLSVKTQKITPKYAKFFYTEIFENYKKLTVLNPWDNSQIYACYYLVSKNNNLPKNLPNDALVIHTPVSSIAVLSTPHIGMLDKLNLTAPITGIGEVKYIYNNNIRKSVSNKTILELGSSSNLNMEQLLNLKPDILLATGYQTANTNLQQANHLGIQVVYGLDWMEQNALARAEWLKFIALFFEKDKYAETVFSEIETHYLNVKQKVLEVNKKPKVLVGQEWKGVWNTPGGNSYFARLLQDAGADYYWKDNSSTGSLALSFEDIIDKQSDADIWLNPGQFTNIKDLLKSNNKLSYIKAVKHKKVYSYTKMTNNIGANAYWETGGVNPDLVLSDLIKICQPKLLPNYQLYYYKKLD